MIILFFCRIDENVVEETPEVPADLSDQLDNRYEINMVLLILNV